MKLRVQYSGLFRKQRFITIDCEIQMDRYKYGSSICNSVFIPSFHRTKIGRITDTCQKAIQFIGANILYIFDSL